MAFRPAPPRGVTSSSSFSSEQQRSDASAYQLRKPADSHDHAAQAQSEEPSSFTPAGTAGMTRQRGWATATEMNEMDFQSHRAHDSDRPPSSALSPRAPFAPTPDMMYTRDREQPISTERGPTGHAVFRPQLVKPRQTFIAYRSDVYKQSLQQHMNFVPPLTRYYNAHRQTPSDPTDPRKARDLYQQMHPSQKPQSPQRNLGHQRPGYPLPRYYARVDHHQIPDAQAGVYHTQSLDKETHHRQGSDGVFISTPLARETSNPEIPTTYFQPQAQEAKRLDATDTAVENGPDDNPDDNNDDDDDDDPDEGLFAIPLQVPPSPGDGNAKNTTQKKESLEEGPSTTPCMIDDEDGSDDGLFAIPMSDIQGQKQKQPTEGRARVGVASNENPLKNENDNDNNSSDDDNGLFAEPLKPVLHQEKVVDSTRARSDDKMHECDDHDGEDDGDSDDGLFAIPLDGGNASSAPTSIGKNQGGESRMPTHNNSNIADAPAVSPTAVNVDDGSDEDSLFAIPLDGQQQPAVTSKRALGSRANLQTPSFRPPPSKSNPTDNTHLRPALKIDTDTHADQRPRTSASVSFHTPLPTASTSTPAHSSTFDTSSDDKPTSSSTGDLTDYPGYDQTGPSSVASSPDNSSAQPGPGSNPRRESILRDDVWASRPPVEGMLERLDEFFPNIDLDQPYFDGAVATSPAEAEEIDSQTETKQAGAVPATTPPTAERLPRNLADRETITTSYDASGQETGIVTPAYRPQAISSASQLPPSKTAEDLKLRSYPTTSSIQEEAISVPQEVYDARPPKPDRMEQKDATGGGLGRMKSIRQVAKGAHELHRKRSIRQAAAAAAAARASAKNEYSAGLSRSERPGANNTPNRYAHENTPRPESSPLPEPLLRRKSTKLFGANIMQIKPRPGERLSRLQNLEQDAPRAGKSKSYTPGSAREASRHRTSRQHPAEVLGPKLPTRQPTFRIIRGELIGKGTYGRVYVAFNADTGDILAVKHVELNPKAIKDKHRVSEMLATLDREIDTMQHLEHPNIVQFLGCERGETSVSIFLEYIPGGSIGSCLRKHGKFEESVVRSLTRQTLSGLAYLHDQGILHRDLKADNLLLDHDGTCKISDFGISKKTDNIYGKDTTNSMQGSVFWMAPEVIQGGGYSAKVDIWSLGCVVLEMFAGRRPWGTEEAVGAIFKLGSLNQAPPIPDDVSSSISPAGLAFMYDCLTIDPPERPTATTLLGHPFCMLGSQYNFYNTDIYAKIRHVVT